MELAEEYELKIIEDACEAIGAEYLNNNSKFKTQNSNLRKKNQHQKSAKSGRNIKNSKKYQEVQKRKIWRKVGTFGDCGVFGFYPNKQITTGEGGMVITDNFSEFT